MATTQIQISPKPADGRGSISGHQACCSCGLTFATSLGEAEIMRQAAEHTAWHDRAVAEGSQS